MMVNAGAGKVHMISGNGCGVKVYCAAAAYAVFQGLTKQSHNQNYWAMMIVKGIKGLRTGVINSNDVFVKSTQHRASQEFTVILPGCSVLAERRSDGSYFITRIDASLDYFKMQENAHRPGLFVVDFKQNGWNAEFVENGKLTSNSDNHVVGVGDRGFAKPKDAAMIIGKRIKETVNPIVERSGYDLFYTPGKRRIGGLINYRQAMGAEKDSGLHEAAVLLADIMVKARKVPNVTWFADFGGSGIVTQAMRILKDKQIRLESHYLYLYRPTTRKDVAHRLSQELGMKLDRDFIKSNFLNISEVTGAASLVLPFQRWRSEKGYTFLNMGVDYAKGIAGGREALKTAGAFGAAAAAAVAFPAISTVAGAIFAAGSLAVAHAPNTVDRLTARG